jgi:hypothetical protein
VSGETGAVESGWTVDTLNAHIQQQLADLRVLLDERYRTQTKAVDAAFLAQQTAMTTALTAAERAVQTALLAAEKAVAKAETSAEKRFDAVNEFRAAYQDLIAAQMPRAEAEQRLQQLAESLSEVKTAMTTSAGHSAGLTDGWKLAVGAVGFLAAVAAIVSTIAALR